MRTPEECGKAVMKVFVELTKRPDPVERGWDVGELSTGQIVEAIGDTDNAHQDIACALERQWIVEKAPGANIYCPTETGFRECWDS